MATDSEYIKGLEFLVCSLAKTHQDNFEKFYWENFKICDYTNPEKRELTELEKTIIMKFTTFQGRTRKIIKNISKVEKQQPDNMGEVIKRLTN